MIKVSLFAGSSEELGPRVIPLFGPADAVFEKTAAPQLLPEVVGYISKLHPRNDAQYVLINAMGAGEFYGSNVNGDYFSEASLIHAPDDWTHNPLIDRIKAKDWGYGYPTFYYAKPFLHHRNKPTHPHFGEIELAAWNPCMKRVELIARVDKDLCDNNGGTGIWDKLRAGDYPDVSMGCFPAGNLVTMEDGTRRPIEKIKVGDFVLTHRGRARRVTELHRRMYRGRLHTIRAEAHETITTTHRHAFWAIPAGQARHSDRWLKDPAINPDWVHAGCLDKHYLLEPVLEETLTPDYATRSFCRLLGYYLAEGCVLRDKSGNAVAVEFTTHVDDAIHGEIVELCEDFGTKNLPHTTPHPVSEKARRITVFDSRLALLCLEHAGGYANRKKLSSQALRWDPAMQREILGAYANGDGCATKLGALLLSTASTDLAWQWMALLPRLGIVASIQNLEHKAGSGFSAHTTYEWVIHIGKQWSRTLSDVTVKATTTDTLKTKLSRPIIDGYVLTPIRTNTAIETEIEVFNLEVEEDASYLVAGLAVHNCRVPFDTCSICLDWDTYRKAQATFDPKRHAHPGMAVLEWHKKKSIRGVSITRKDYCQHALRMMNKILPDGRKVFVYNDYPRFFDISFVFIGADKTAKVMMKIAGDQKKFWSLGGAELAEQLGYEEESKAAEGDTIKVAFLKGAKNKSSEITKDVVPSQFAGKAVPLLTRGEPDLPRDVLDALGCQPLTNSLSTTAGLGIILRPREFQRVVLTNLGQSNLADEYEQKNVVFPRSGDSSPVDMGTDFFSSGLARMLLPLLADRSLIAPMIEQRVLIVLSTSPEQKKNPSSHSSDLLRKMGSAYNTYRTGVMDLVSNAQSLIASATSPEETALHKIAHAPVEETFTPLSAAYIKLAFWDEVGLGVSTAGAVEPSQARVTTEKGHPSRNAWH
jgi:LAGLIDADG DNA endonuclease family protein